MEPTETQTNMSCAFVLPKNHHLINSATISWQLPPTAPSIFNASSNCPATFRVDASETLVCSTVSLGKLIQNFTYTIIFIPIYYIFLF